jgi:lipid-binding SYLF domain-containing protein
MGNHARGQRRVIRREPTMLKVRRAVGLLACALALATSMSARPAGAGSAAEINRDVDAALTRLYATVPETRSLASRAKGILVFPNIVKTCRLALSRSDTSCFDMQNDVYAMFFDQTGLMSGLGFPGSKISRMER